MKKLVVAVLLAASIVSSTAHACDMLRVMGFPESCVRACGAGYNAYDLTMCAWDMATDW